MAKTRSHSLHRCLTLGALIALDACGGSALPPHPDADASLGGPRAPPGRGGGGGGGGPSRDGAGASDARVGPLPDGSTSSVRLDSAAGGLNVDAATVPADGPGTEPGSDAGTPLPSP